MIFHNNRAGPSILPEPRHHGMVHQQRAGKRTEKTILIFLAMVFPNIRHEYLDRMKICMVFTK
jgi:hypothetical protein